MAFEVLLPTISEDAQVGVAFTCDGAGKAPQVSWSDPPDGTKSYALIVHDPDAPDKDFVHWLLADIPGDASEIAEGSNVPEFGVSGKNDFGKLGYGGPCPPPGDRAHRYFFELCALDLPILGLPKGFTRNEIEATIMGHVLARATAMRAYVRAARAQAA